MESDSEFAQPAVPGQSRAKSPRLAALGASNCGADLLVGYCWPRFQGRRAGGPQAGSGSDVAADVLVG